MDSNKGGTPSSLKQYDRQVIQYEFACLDTDPRIQKKRLNRGTEEKVKGGLGGV